MLHFFTLYIEALFEKLDIFKNVHFLIYDNKIFKKICIFRFFNFLTFMLTKNRKARKKLKNFVFFFLNFSNFALFSFPKWKSEKGKNFDIFFITIIHKHINEYDACIITL